MDYSSNFLKNLGRKVEHIKVVCGINPFLFYCIFRRQPLQDHQSLPLIRIIHPSITIMQQGDYTTPYYHHTYPPIPTTDPHHPPFNHASAPPFTTTPSYHPPPPPPPPDHYPPLPNPNPNPQFDASQPPYQSQPIYNPPYDQSPYNNNNNPTQFPTQSPNHSLSHIPTQFPTHLPSQDPTHFPSQVPNQFPSQVQSQVPSHSLSQAPSQFPSQSLSQFPSQVYETGYGGSVSDVGGVDYYGKRPDMGNSRFESNGGGYDGYGGDGYGEGVYAYQGGKVEPYGSRGTGPKSSTWKEQVLFDDFGRPIGMQGKGKESGSGLAPKIVKAVPKAETREDVKGGVQKFRVKLLAESGGQSTMDVLCQIGLDGIRMLDPSTSRTLRIYSLDTITRCEKYDSSTLAFWSKSSVDIEPRRIRLQSNSYTTSTLLDTVTAATFQAKEMGGSSRPVDAVRVTEQSTEKKKGLGDWMNIIKPANEEKDHWVPDEAVTKCTGCGSDFSAFNRKHHCRNCGDIFCDKCTHGRTALTSEENAPQVRVCDRCMVEVTHRLSSAKEAAASRTSGLQSHEDLAKKLQELERNHKSSSGSRSGGSSRRMKEVACPTCTVHLQVQVPISGSETIECGVCQHPFLVNSR